MGGAGQCAAYSIDVRGAGQGPERITASSYAPGTYYVVVDSVNAVGASGSCGQYSLSVTGSLGAVTVPDGGTDGGVHVDAGPHDVVAMDVVSSDIGTGKPKNGAGCSIAPEAIAGGPSARQLGLALLALVLCARRRRRR